MIKNYADTSMLWSGSSIVKLFTTTVLRKVQFLLTVDSGQWNATGKNYSCPPKNVLICKISARDLPVKRA
jgi:hypothetical protein